MDVAPENKEAIFSLLMDAFSKLYGAFRSVKVFLTSDPPDRKEWGEDFTKKLGLKPRYFDYAQHIAL